MPTYRLITQLLILAVVVIGIVWDVVADYFGGNSATISVVIREAVIAEPMIGVAIGVALGHWFWPQSLAKG